MNVTQKGQNLEKYMISSATDPPTAGTYADNRI